MKPSRRLLSLVFSNVRILLGCGFVFGWLPLLDIFIAEGVFAYHCSSEDSVSDTGFGPIYACSKQQHLLNLDWTLSASMVDLSGLIAGIVFTSSLIQLSTRRAAILGDFIHGCGALLFTVGALLDTSESTEVRDWLWFVGYLWVAGAAMFVYIPLLPTTGALFPGQRALIIALGVSLFNGGVAVGTLFRLLYQHGVSLSVMFGVYTGLDFICLIIASILYTDQVPSSTPDSLENENQILSIPFLTSSDFDFESNQSLLINDDLETNSIEFRGLVLHVLVLAVPLKYILGEITSEITVLSPDDTGKNLSSWISYLIWIPVWIFGPFVGVFNHWLGAADHLAPEIRRKGNAWALATAAILLIVFCILRISENIYAIFVGGMIIIPIVWCELYSSTLLFLNHVIPIGVNDAGILFSSQALVILCVWPLTIWGLPDVNVVKTDPYYLFIGLGVLGLIFPYWYNKNGRLKSFPNVKRIPNKNGMERNGWTDFLYFVGYYR